MNKKNMKIKEKISINEKKIAKLIKLNEHKISCII